MSFSIKSSPMRSAQVLTNNGARIMQLLDEINCSPSKILQILAQLIVQNLYSDTHIAARFINACHDHKLLHLPLYLFTNYNNKYRYPIFTYNTLLRSLAHFHSYHSSLTVYSHIHKHSIPPNNYTFPFILKSLSDNRDLKTGQTVHTQVIKLGHLDDIYIRNSILDLYASCGRMRLCRKVFDEMTERDVVSWTVLIMGYKLVNKSEESLIAFEEMRCAGVKPNRVTMVNALGACASLGALEMGIWMHDIIRQNGWEIDVILGTTLIDMYGTCGKIEEGIRIFESMNVKNDLTWNVVIKGLALAESGDEVVRWFYRMEQQGFRPNEVTLISVLSACSHLGLVHVGREIFASLLDEKYGFSAGIKHYACMIDLLSRAGYLGDAFRLMEEMPFDPTVSIWGSLLVGCQAQKDFTSTEFVARKLIELEPDNGAHYAVLSNLYADMGRWDDVANIRDKMKERRLQKDLGWSSIDHAPHEYDHKFKA